MLISQSGYCMNLAELHSAVEAMLADAKHLKVHPETVFIQRPTTLNLAEIMLTDGSKVYDLIISRESLGH